MNNKQEKERDGVGMDVGFLLHDQALSVDKAELTTCASDDESVGEDELIMYPPHLLPDHLNIRHVKWIFNCCIII